MYDRFKKRMRVGRVDDRLRRQIATEAARRLMPRISPDPSSPHLKDVSTLEYETAKRQAVAVLGHRVRPSDLPTDAEVRAQVLQLRSSVAVEPVASSALEDDEPTLERLADHLDRFSIFKMRLEPLHEIKLNPRWHPEGDALFHSLQVFERARDVRPYDEEFLLAALLHDIGRAIDPGDPVPAALSALAGTVSDRTCWLITHLPDLLPRQGRPAPARVRQELRRSTYYEDLELLAELDLAGRERGVAVDAVDEVLGYLRSLEADHELPGDA
jgi:hypothetical protein